MPGQSIMTKHQALLYTSDNVTAQKLKKSWFSRCLNFVRAIQNSGLNTELKNDTSTMGYAGLQLMKGKVIVLDNGIDATRNMVVKEKYVIAHTNDLSLQAFNSANPLPQARLQAQRDENPERNDILGGGQDNFQQLDLGGVAGGNQMA